MKNTLVNNRIKLGLEEQLYFQFIEKGIKSPLMQIVQILVTKFDNDFLKMSCLISEVFISSQIIIGTYIGERKKCPMK